MAFPTYTSVIGQTIRTVQHLDGVETDYVFVPGTGARNFGDSNYGDGTYGGTAVGGGVTPATLEEKLVLDDLAVAYGLTVT